jgi:hypothetical protein
MSRGYESRAIGCSARLSVTLMSMSGSRVEMRSGDISSSGTVFGRGGRTCGDTRRPRGALAGRHRDLNCYAEARSAVIEDILRSAAEEGTASGG